jgi:hypothetical protein
VSNLSRIEPLPAADGYPPTEIFGKEPAHNWCYYFQKADLARQLGDWQSVVRLGNEAQEKGFSPSSPQEWLPFIEGYAYTGQWEKALKRTREAFEMDEAVAPRLCRAWQRIQDGAAPPLDIQGQLDQLLEPMQCGQASTVGFQAVP